MKVELLRWMKWSWFARREHINLTVNLSMFCDASPSAISVFFNAQSLLTLQSLLLDSAYGIGHCRTAETTSFGPPASVAPAVVPFCNQHIEVGVVCT